MGKDTEESSGVKKKGEVLLYWFSLVFFSVSVLLFLFTIFNFSQEVTVPVLETFFDSIINLE